MTRTRKPDRRSILIVDDHQLIRQSMAQVLRTAFETAEVIEATSFDEALKKLADPGVFLAVVDLSIPGMGSPRELEKLRRRRPDVRVVVLTGSEERSDILDALAAGVHGYIIKKERTEKLIDQIKYVLSGEIYVPPMLSELPPELPKRAAQVTATAQPQRDRIEALTDRQKDVLRLIGDGLGNKEIGRRLNIAEGTVKMHVTTILRSVGATNRAHAAAISKQYLDPSAKK